ncbi:uroporphyrinogen-III synthase [Salinibacterium sp. SYSU T00001]|uniref:uroporphyrinogen-III synthase n=1 Tax=Homoserinimonas sedimenticola TaxID=2986805 RepID=UPI002235CA10|nr:uroporphyrinogen-III synthase [Salinibacterium sedimenticola]MCW4384858.1 uroporphyrinogen-III synthase [Salinibacterium sedimenticola]
MGRGLVADPMPGETDAAASAHPAAPELTVPGFRHDQLEGFRIGVTSHRRSEDLIDAFERRGATVMHGPTLRVTHAQVDGPVLADTRAIVEARPDVLLATTGYGVRRWFEVADAAGLGDELTEVLGKARILVRGPKARGGIRAAGLDDDGMSDAETTESLVSKALEELPAGLTVAVQLHGHTDELQLSRLRERHRVLTVAPYSWTHLGSTDERVQRLVEAICARSLDAVTFTSAPSVDALFIAAECMGLLDPLQDAMRSDVLAAAVGPVTAAPLLAARIRVIQPERYRMGALIRLLCEHLETTSVQRIATTHGPLVLRGQLVEVNGRRMTLPLTPLALLRRLAVEPGSVVSRADLVAALPGAQDDHVMEVALSRLRQALDTPGLVMTVVKRGYRLDV